MIASAIGAGLKIGSSIFGGIKMSQAMKKVRNDIKEQQQDNQNWFDRRYNEDSTQRADAQRMLTLATEQLRDRNKQMAAAQYMMGGTDESVAAQKAASANALASTTGQIAAAADARKDNVENQFMSNKRALSDKMNDTRIKSAEEMKKAVESASDTANDIMNSDYLNKQE